MGKKKKIVLICIFVISIATAMFFSIAGIRKSKSLHAEKQYSMLASTVHAALEGEISRPINTSLTMANDIFLIDLLKREGELEEQEITEKISAFLTAIKKVTNAQSAFVISDFTKKYYSFDGLNKIIDGDHDEHDIWYPIFVNKRKAYDMDVDTDEVNGNAWTVFVNARIEDEKGTFLGVCGVGMSMESLQEILMDYEEKNNMKINFINSEGLVQVDTDNVNIENAHLNDVQYGKEKDGYSYWNENGEFVVMQYVNSLDWYLVVHGAKIDLEQMEILPILLGGFVVILLNMAVWLFLTRKK